MPRFGTATYDLYEIQDLLKTPGSRIITRECYRNAVSLGYSSEEEIVNRVLQLRPSDLYKTMEAESKPGLWQDVYHSNEGSITLYIKLQLSFNGKGVVIQFKRK
ncbi:type II toxin-antitoxin system MqsR family toxin [Desulfobacula phenolica]|uniref:type II toxin-antitoxin system MqsR family toxin n=1 Tax=Desulfobacula phenolica TaxID=90732 RepID=UPI001587C29B|nr:type II toxin-antitoxin system MqsR family toxin [Desulfobacula phenolica]